MFDISSIVYFQKIEEKIIKYCKMLGNQQRSYAQKGGRQSFCYYICLRIQKEKQMM